MLAPFTDDLHRQLLSQDAAGMDFPEQFGHISFVTLPELRRLTAELRLSPESTLVDLGCGMAGPALWVARETGCTFPGVDFSFSPVAVARAGTRAAGLGLARRAKFVVGTFEATGA